MTSSYSSFHCAVQRSALAGASLVIVIGARLGGQGFDSSIALDVDCETLLNSVRTLLTCADSDNLLDCGDPDLAITDLASRCCLTNHVHHVVGH